MRVQVIPKLAVLVILVILGGWFYFHRTHSSSISNNLNNQSAPTNTVSSQAARFGFPLDRALERIIKKPFGIYITSKTSPVQPEKFTGYHTGTDFEVFPSETNTVVFVHAICDGAVLLKQWVSGYGGVLVQSCTLNDQPITVLYGHLDPLGSALQVGDKVTLGRTTVGKLGRGYSHDTDGERKHLHLGVHKGSKVDLLGYVAKASDLSQWLDVITLLPSK